MMADTYGVPVEGQWGGPFELNEAIGGYLLIILNEHLHGFVG